MALQGIKREVPDGSLCASRGKLFEKTLKLTSYAMLYRVYF